MKGLILLVINPVPQISYRSEQGKKPVISHPGHAIQTVYTLMATTST